MHYHYLELDNVRIQTHLNLINTLTTSAQPAGVLSPFNIYVSVTDNQGNKIELIPLIHPKAWSSMCCPGQNAGTKLRFAPSTITAWAGITSRNCLSRLLSRTAGNTLLLYNRYFTPFPVSFLRAEEPLSLPSFDHSCQDEEEAKNHKENRRGFLDKERKRWI